MNDTKDVVTEVEDTERTYSQFEDDGFPVAAGGDDSDIIAKESD